MHKLIMTTHVIVTLIGSLTKTEMPTCKQCAYMYQTNLNVVVMVTSVSAVYLYTEITDFIGNTEPECQTAQQIFRLYGMQIQIQ